MKKEFISGKSINQIYENDLKILLNIKKSVGLLHNAIHDKAALMAINILKDTYPEIDFCYKNAGAGGFDLIGKKGKKIELVGEVKTTLIERRNTIMDPPMRNIKKDLERLKNKKVNHKYLILVSEKVEENLKRRLDFKKEYPEIKILTVFKGY